MTATETDLTLSLETLLTKRAVYRALAGKVPCPKRWELDMSKQNKGAISAVQEQLTSLLAANPSMYLKPGDNQSSSGVGIVKLVLDEKKLTLIVPRQETQRAIERRLSTAWTKDPANALHYLDHGPHHNSIDIYFRPVNGQQQPLSVVLSGLLLHGFKPEVYVIEPSLSIPLYDEKTWETRTVFQCPKGFPEPMADFARVGMDALTCHSARGGTALPVLTVLQRIYRDNGALTEEEALHKAEAYRAANKAVTEHAARLFVDFVRGTAAPLYPGVERMRLFPREFSVDLAAEFNQGKLAPALMEVQYPLGPTSYAKQLRWIGETPTLDLIQANNRDMEMERVLIGH